MRHRVLLILIGYIALHWMFLGVHFHYIKWDVYLYESLGFYKKLKDKE